MSTALDFKNERTLPSDYRGDVLVWDIDKTYLDTQFSSLRGLLAIPFELAIDKQALPGTVPLLRALRHGPLADSAVVPLYFVSGSPKHLRAVLERKMTLDGVQWDGIALKDQLGLVLRGRPRAVVEQVGHKVLALVKLRAAQPQGVRYLLFGDDVESDREAFLLFGAVCAGLRGAALDAALKKHGVFNVERRALVAQADALAIEPDPVAHVFIHTVRGARDKTAAAADPRVIVTRSALEQALVLAQLGRIRAAALPAILADVSTGGRRLSTEAIAAQLDRAVAVLGVAPALVEPLRAQL